MLRMTANKTKLYTLVAGYVENLPPMRGGTIFVKYPRTPDYALDWITPEWNKAHAFFSTCMGRPRGSRPGSGSAVTGSTR